MKPNGLIRILLAFVGWTLGGALAGAVIGIVLFIVIMIASKSEAVGQGLLLLLAWLILIPIGAAIGFTRALFQLEKQKPLYP